MPELFLAGVPGSFRYRRCDRCVYAMQYFPALPSTFSGIAAFLESGGYARSGLDLICITEDRESKHTSGRRSGVDTANYMMARGLRGKRVVIVDDLLTSGDSLLEYAHNLERVGAIVTGAVFFGPYVPDAPTGNSQTGCLETSFIGAVDRKVRRRRLYATCKVYNTPFTTLLLCFLLIRRGIKFSYSFLNCFY